MTVKKASSCVDAQNSRVPVEALRRRLLWDYFVEHRRHRIALFSQSNHASTLNSEQVRWAAAAD